MKQIYFSFLSVFLFFGHASGQCTTPVLSNVATPDPICSGEIATLTADTDAGTIMWYETATGTIPVETGDTFESGIITETTSFWVEAENVATGPPMSGGKAAPSGTSGSTVLAASTPWGLVFNASHDFVLNSVDVFLSSSSPGNIVFELKNSSFVVLETLTVAVPAGGTGTNPVQFTVPLGLTIPQGNGYRLVAVTSPAMIRDFSGTNSYPYPLGTVGSITQGTINDSNSNSGVYYFFYNWNVSQLFYCNSVREEVVVTVNTVDPPAGDEEQEFADGETLADLDVTGQDLNWYSDADGTNPIPDTTPLSDGFTYYVNQTVNGCTSEMLAVTADNPLAVANHAFAALKFYPNPVSDFLNISNELNFDSAEVYNVQGQLLFEHKYEAREASIDFSNFSSAIYILKMRSGKAITTFKVVKN